MSNGDNHPPPAFTESEIRNRVSALFAEHNLCGGDQHLLVVTRAQIDLQHGYGILNGCAKTFKLTAEQVAIGLAPTEWNSLVRKIKKAQLEAER